MLTFDSQEYIELVEELLEDAIDVQVIKNSGKAFNPETLETGGAESEPIHCKMLFITPSMSRTMDWEQEISNEDFQENKIAILTLRENLETGSRIESDVGTYYVTAVAAINPLGPTIYTRVKVGRNFKADA